MNFQQIKRKLKASALIINRLMTIKQGRLVKRYGAVASLAWVVIGVIGGLFAFSNDGKLNEMGDFFAGWFSPLAFTWFVYAVFLQMKELKATNETMNLQKEELEGSKLALREQSKTLNRQNIENTFFKMIESLQDIIGGMTITEKEYISDSAKKVFLTGRTALASIHKEFERMIIGCTSEEDFIKKYEYLYEENGENLGHYFRMLNRIIEFIEHHTELHDTDKIGLIKILRPHLSDGELFLLFINSHYKYGKPMTPYIKKHEMLDNFTLRTRTEDDILVNHAKNLNVKYEIIDKSTGFF
ncbi:putative phage abortive infection protein [Terasakiella sp. SH-1]|uniref:putative phage abortive infection protein n=1 Tax=Terasakiella sp. SH-1 TaxID=2560057 RepID=UPI001073CA0E|nr:putative phage abortive infection protein [Terasakiella sp. SH-1]